MKEQQYDHLGNAIKNFLIAWLRLKELNVLNTKKDFTSQIGEFLIAELYDGQLSTNSIQKDWDITLQDGRKIQVKSHAKSATNDNRWTPVPYDENADIDLYIIVVFTEDYKLKHLYEIHFDELWKLSQQDKTRRLIRWSKLAAYDKLLDASFYNKDLIRLFLDN